MDLNLYSVFVEVMRHGSVSRAAEALGLTQSATSNALSRLRHQTGDQLFVRSRTGMLPTHFAQQKFGEIEAAVACLREMKASDSNHLPALAGIRRHFRLVTSDLEETLILPDLVDHFSAAAPDIHLQVSRYRSDRLQQDLERDRIDFAIAYVMQPVKNVVTRPLCHQDFVCVTRQNHPEIDDDLSLQDYTRLPHMLVTPDRAGRRGVVDDRLQAMGERRRVTLTVPHFLSAALLLARSDHLLTLPRGLALRAAALFGLQCHELPFEMPGFSIGLHWHWTRNGDLEHRAFREEILALADRWAGQPPAPR